MTIGFILLSLTGLLILFGAGQRVLDRLRLTDRQALLFIALIIAGGFLPDISVTETFAFNLGGALMPLLLCLWLLVKAGTGRERARCLISTLVSAVAIYALGRYLPAEPEALPMDPAWAYGIAAGLIAWVFGRSRRGAYVAGTLGVMLAQVFSWLTVLQSGVSQRLALGGAGGYDATVVAGLLAVLITELVGEAAERLTRGANSPARALRGGEAVRRATRG